MKSSAVLKVLGGFILVVSGIVAASNVTWGYIRPYDRLLATDHVLKPSGWFSTQTAVVVYPPKGHTNYVTLSAVRVYDWGGRKNFGYVSLIKGGPGYRNATTYIKSQRGKPLNVTIQYFGR